MFAIRAVDDQGRKVDVVPFIAEGNAQEVAAQLEAIGWTCEVVPAVALPEVAALLQARPSTAPAPVAHALPEAA
jgi:hypothetical protein